MPNKIQYRRVGDYLIPNLILPPEEINITLGKWGMMHKSYHEKHKKVFLVCCLVKVNFISTVPRLKNQALAMFDMLVEQLKEENQLEWVQKTNLINISAREIVENEILYG